MSRSLINIDALHTTDLGVKRIKRNLKLETDDVVDYIKDIILSGQCRTFKKGKNIYCETKDISVTINSTSYTIITAHLI